MGIYEDDKILMMIMTTNYYLPAHSTDLWSDPVS